MMRRTMGAGILLLCSTATGALAQTGDGSVDGGNTQEVLPDDRWDPVPPGDVAPAPQPYVAPQPQPYVAPAPQPAPQPYVAPPPPAARAEPPPQTTRENTPPVDQVRHTERSRHFWFDLSAGYSWINLVALDQSGLTPDPQLTKSSGFVFEGGLGVQFSILRLGVASSYALYGGFDVATAEADLAIVIPIPIVEPYFEAGFGYGWIRNVEETNAMTGVTRVVPIHGIAVDLGFGLDFHLSDAVQLGVNVDASLLNLQRQRVTDLQTINNVDFTKPGNSLGLQIHGLARLSFEF